MSATGAWGAPRGRTPTPTNLFETRNFGHAPGGERTVAMSTGDDRTRPSMPASEASAEDRSDASGERARGPARHAGSGQGPASGPTSGVKTSVAAAFALALGVAALVLVLTVVLSPLGALFGIIGLILGVVGIRAARQPARTGKGVAITGLVFSIVALLLVAAAAVGVVTFLNDPGAVGQLQQQVEQLRGQVPGLAPAPGS